MRVKKIAAVLASIVAGMAVALFLGAGLGGGEHVSGTWFGVLVAALVALAGIFLSGRLRGGSRA